MNSTQQATVDEWNPYRRPLHCSNCANCRVSGTAAQPRVTCAKGHNHPQRPSLPYWSVMRMKHPVGFRMPAECPGWESMDDNDD